ncbi:MAG: MotA/TolQ/ExbB proton channel family [Planctomycetota bacterium]|jgi:biopolymer transport protein ExbB/TolQ
MNLFGHLLTGVLLIQSVLALAILFDAILHAGIRSRQTLRLLFELQTQVRSLPGMEPRQRAQRVRDVTLRNAVELLLLPAPQTDLADRHFHRWLTRLDQGISRLNSLLTRTAPLVGLAGTLAGISASMARFQQRTSNPDVLVAGFALAIETTLYGIFVTCACLTADRLFWQKLKNMAREVWLNIESELLMHGPAETPTPQPTGPPPIQNSDNPRKQTNRPQQTASCHHRNLELNDERYICSH